MSLDISDMDQFNEGDDFSLWRIKMKAWLMYEGLSEAISRDELEALALEDELKAKDIMLKAHSALVLCLGDDVLRKVINQETSIELWEKLEEMFLKESLAKKVNLKKRSSAYTKEESKELMKNKENFSKNIGDLKSKVDKEKEEDQAIKLLSSLPKAYGSIVATMSYEGKVLSMKDERSILRFDEAQNSEEGSKGDKEERLCVSGRSEGRLSKDLEEARHFKEEPRECFSSHEEDHQGWECHEKEKLQDLVGGEGSKIAQVVESNDSSKMVVEAANHTWDEWVLDSRCSCHKSPNGSWSEGFKKNEGAVLLVDMELCQNLNPGDITQEMSNGSNMDLQGVRYVTKVKSNVSSLDTYDASGCAMVFGKELIKDNKVEEALLGESLMKELYVLHGHTNIGTACKADSNDDTSFQMVHLELENLSKAEVYKEDLSTNGQEYVLKICENTDFSRLFTAAEIQSFGDQMAGIDCHLIEQMQGSDGKLQQLKIQQTKSCARVVDSHEHRMICEGVGSRFLPRVLYTFVFDPGGIKHGALKWCIEEWQAVIRC